MSFIDILIVAAALLAMATVVGVITVMRGAPEENSVGAFWLFDRTRALARRGPDE